MERVGVKSGGIDRIGIERIRSKRIRTERVGSERVDIQPVILQNGTAGTQPHAHLLFDRVDRRDQRAQTDVEEIDVCDRQGDVAMDHDAAVEEAVDQVDESDVAGLSRAPHGRVTYYAGPHRAASIDPLTKL